VHSRGGVEAYEHGHVTMFTFREFMASYAKFTTGHEPE